MGTSRGASIPKRILPRSMSTTVMQMFSPMQIFSPSLRLSTSMVRFPPASDAVSSSILILDHKSSGRDDQGGIFERKAISPSPASSIPNLRSPQPAPPAAAQTEQTHQVVSVVVVGQGLSQAGVGDGFLNALSQD